MNKLMLAPVRIFMAMCLSIAIMMSSSAFAEQGGVTALVVDLEAEIAARQAGDANLQNQITALQNELNAGIHEIGDVLPDGSIVFWVDETDRHGLAAQPSDAFDPDDGDLGITWYKAKEVAENYGPGWRLPTKHELNLLYLQKDVVGGFADSSYWSSTVIDAVYAWNVFFLIGAQDATNKGPTYRVRAVRAF